MHEAAMYKDTCINWSWVCLWAVGVLHSASGCVYLLLNLHI